MKIYSVFDPEFKPYGQVVSGYDTACLVDVMNTIPMPASGTAYEPSIPALEATCAYGQIQNNVYGGMPVELGMCWGYNTKLNCLEYHRDSEFDMAADDLVLLLARQEQIENGKLDTALVKAFRVPAGVMVEIYATTLHFAPCHCDGQKGFRMMVALPRGTNTERPAVKNVTPEDDRLWARNKWLLAHPDSDEAKQGAYIGLTGENIDIQNYI